MLYTKVALAGMALFAGQASAAPVASHEVAAAQNTLDPVGAVMSAGDCKKACKASTPINVHVAFGAKNKPAIMDSFFTGCFSQCTTGKYVNSNNKYVGPGARPDGTVGAADTTCETTQDCLFTEEDCDSQCTVTVITKLNENFLNKEPIYKAMKGMCKATCAGIEETTRTIDYPLGGRSEAEIHTDCMAITPINVFHTFGQAEKDVLMPKLRDGCKKGATQFVDTKADITPACASDNSCKYSEADCDVHCGETPSLRYPCARSPMFLAARESRASPCAAVLHAAGHMDLHDVLINWPAPGEKPLVYHATKYACMETCMAFEKAAGDDA